MPKWSVLAVDDEPINLEIIAESLGDMDCSVTRAADGEEAWNILGGRDGFDLVILDRMMPRLDGLAVLRRIKGDARFAGLPVVMQTAASSPEQVREGVEAGAYYYLTKPYDPRALLAIVRAALHGVESYRRARQAEAGFAAFQLAQRGEFRFRDLEQARALATLLAGLCPDPTTATIGLSELMINAVEHGNLGISYAEKRSLRLANTWEQEVARRLQAPILKDRKAQVAFERGNGRIAFTIADQGEGFDPAGYMSFDPARVCDPNGRGIAICRKLAFSSVEFRGAGNIVVASVNEVPHV